MHAWVGQREPVFVEHAFAVEQEVEVERARGILKLAHAAVTPLDRKQSVEERVGREGRLHHHDGVDEVWLLQESHRRRPIERRSRDEPCLGQRADLHHAARDVLARGVEVAAQGHEGDLPHRTSRSTHCSPPGSPTISAPATGRLRRGRRRRVPVPVPGSSIPLRVSSLAC